jgi:hypothetical protein
MLRRRAKAEVFSFGLIVNFLLVLVSTLKPCRQTTRRKTMPPSSILNGKVE